MASEAAALAEAPLRGQRLVLTRAENQLGEARRLFEAAGAEVLDLPALVIVPPDHWGPLDDALAELDSFHWLVFSSANGVEALEQRLRQLGSGLAQRPRGLRIAAVGRKTAQLLAELGAAADFVPPDFVAESLLEHFPVGVWGQRILLPRVQSGGRTLLAEAFGEAGARVVEVAAYNSICPNNMPEATAIALEQCSVRAICFSSGKTVSHSLQLLQQRFGDHWQQLMEGVAIVSIGPQTSNSCRQLLGRVSAEASPHSLEGLVDACVRALGEAAAAQS
jgi:uroporphyrinogen-III synthase